MISSIPTSIKFIIAILWDLTDFTIGRIPGSGTLFDIIGGLVAMGLWGETGILAFWEVLDISDQIDAELPTATLIGILAYIRGRA